MRVLIIMILIGMGHNICAQSFNFEYPVFGAQVFIEPGQTEEETELWFRTLRDNGLTICRIRMFESYMLQTDGTWDFSLFDRAFQLAEKYDIKVMGTFFPATAKTDIGGWKFPKDDAQLASFAEYIKQLTTHFKQFKSLYSWVLINEPGGGLNDNEFSRKMRQLWDIENPQVGYLENGYPVLVDLQDARFRQFMTSWMLNWIAGEVRKYDKDIHLHVNNHAIFSNLKEYDFPYWQTFLNSLGGSAHASWHFGLFTRKEYALAMSANSEMLLSGAGKLPWMMTELQGGNNTYSGGNAMCPTSEEITQWLWTIIGTEGRGGIFWSLNPRASGVESGEWALLDFQHQPTDRVDAIKKVSEAVMKNQALFSKMKKPDPGINLLYIKESLWTEGVITQGTPAASDGRYVGLNDLLGYFKAFTEMGISPNIRAFEEFDFSENDYEGTTIILPHQIAITGTHVKLLEHFAEKGGKLIVDGMSAYYDENVHNTMLTGFPLEALFGGNISEFRYIDEPHEYQLDKDLEPIPGVNWKGIIKADNSSTILGKDGAHVIATRHSYGKGEVVWIPGVLGVHAKNVSGKPLAGWLAKECKLEKQAFYFADYQEGMMMKTMQFEDSFLTIIINKSGMKKSVSLKGAKENLKSKVLFKDQDGSITDHVINLDAEETIVVSWE